MFEEASHPLGYAPSRHSLGLLFLGGLSLCFFGALSCLLLGLLVILTLVFSQLDVFGILVIDQGGLLIGFFDCVVVDLIFADSFCIISISSLQQRGLLILAFILLGVLAVPSFLIFRRVNLVVLSLRRRILLDCVLSFGLRVISIVGLQQRGVLAVVVLLHCFISIIGTFILFEWLVFLCILLGRDFVFGLVRLINLISFDLGEGYSCLSCVAVFLDRIILVTLLRLDSLNVIVRVPTAFLLGCLILINIV